MDTNIRTVVSESATGRQPAGHRETSSATTCIARLFFSLEVGINRWSRAFTRADRSASWFEFKEEALTVTRVIVTRQVTDLTITSTPRTWTRTPGDGNIVARK